MIQSRRDDSVDDIVVVSRRGAEFYSLAVAIIAKESTFAAQQEVLDAFDARPLPASAALPLESDVLHR
jgi:hypothetical protein